jgi:hypothetical protein
MTAFAIAIAGQKRDIRGALITALAIWLISSFFLYSASDQWRSWWIQYFAALVMTSVSMLLIVLPMIAVRGSDWVRGRLAAGLAGSVVAALVFPGVVLTTGCLILGDCL